MDPVATIEHINYELAQGFYIQCSEYCDYLIEWIDRGGICEVNGLSTSFWRKWVISINNLCSYLCFKEI